MFIAILPPGYQHQQYVVHHILQEMKQAFQAKNKTLYSEGVLTKPIGILFDLTYNPQTQLTKMSI